MVKKFIFGVADLFLLPVLPLQPSWRPFFMIFWPTFNFHPLRGVGPPIWIMRVIFRRTLRKTVFERGESAPNWGSNGGFKIALLSYVWPPISHNSVTPVPSFSRDCKTFLPSRDPENLKEFWWEDFEKIEVKLTEKNQNSRNCRVRDHVWLPISRPSVKVIQIF